ncbi:MAG TPA: hypothetical protein VJT31_14345 [Rugosimonospora sp.]|nr:hypothetical protein [Rugosimonospora sp.]
MAWQLPETTVAIVTALPVESAAVRAMVDDLSARRPPLEDPNYYVGGTMPSDDPNQPHGVVVALLPADNTRNAAAVCIDLLRTFPQVQVVVMAGIAGGIPAPGDPRRHVRLGDVVVAEGVVDCGHVRTQDGVDTPRRHLPGISPRLLRAAHELEVKSLRGVRPWEASLRVQLDGFARPAPASDVLVWHGSPTPHPPRERPGYPVVHRGLIASGDRLLRDEVRRDEIAARFGVIAVEMEASGIAEGAAQHGREWMVVRGVSDYCDSTKNDQWHGWAALVAAAYVRALLAECRPFAPVRDGELYSASPVSPGAPGRPVWPMLISIVDLLLEVPIMAEERGRQAVIDLLRPALRGNIRRHPTARLDVIGIVRACLNYEGGLRELEAAVVSLEATSEPAIRFARRLRAYPGVALDAGAFQHVHEDPSATRWRALPRLDGPAGWPT